MITVYNADRVFLVNEKQHFNKLFNYKTLDNDKIQSKSLNMNNYVVGKLVNESTPYAIPKSMIKVPVLPTKIGNWLDYFKPSGLSLMELMNTNSISPDMTHWLDRYEAWEQFSNAWFHGWKHANN